MPPLLLFARRHGSEYVLELAREAGYAVEERPIRLEELAHADEAFFTGTTTEVLPTVAIDGRPVADGRVGPVAGALFHAFLDGVEDVAAAALPG
jgi:D-alanine transaminase